MKRRQASPYSFWGLAAEGWIVSLVPLAVWVWYTASQPGAPIAGLRPLPDWLWLALLWAGPTWIALRMSAGGGRQPPSAPVERSYSCGVRLAMLTGISITLVLTSVLTARHASAEPESALLTARLLPALVDALVLTAPLSGVLALAWGAHAAWVTRALVLSRWPALGRPAWQRRSRRRVFTGAWLHFWLALQHDPGLAHRFLGHAGRGALWNTGWHLLPALALVATSGVALATLRAGALPAPTLVLGFTALSLGATALLHVAYALLAAADFALTGRSPRPVPASSASVTITPVGQPVRQPLPALAVEPSPDETNVSSPAQPSPPAAA
jgi:hypothetical protein